MAFRDNTNIYITNLDDLYSKYERAEARIDSQSVKRMEENNKVAFTVFSQLNFYSITKRFNTFENKEKKVVSFNNNSDFINSTNGNNISTITSISSAVEKAILSSLTPINTSEVDQVTALGHKGIWLNKDEAINWKGNQIRKGKKCIFY